MSMCSWQGRSGIVWPWQRVQALHLPWSESHQCCGSQGELRTANEEATEATEAEAELIMLAAVVELLPPEPLEEAAAEAEAIAHKEHVVVRSSSVR